MKCPRRNEGEAESLAKLCLDVRMLQKLTTAVLRMRALIELYTSHAAYNKQFKSGIEVQVRRDTDVRQVAGGTGKSDAQHSKND